MSDDDKQETSDFDDRSLLAAELSLGLLSAEEQRAVRRKMREPAGFAAMVEDWDWGLAALGEDFPPVQPAAATLDRINARLFASAAVNSAAAKRTVDRLPVWRRLWPWQGLGLGATAALATLLLFGNFQSFRLPGTAPVAGSAYVLTLQGEQLQLVALLDGDGKTLRVKLVSPPAGTANDFELWAIKGSEAPVSVGVIAGAATAAFPVAIGATPSELTFAVSLEPKGGSPTGAPTGPVLAAAQAVEI